MTENEAKALALVNAHAINRRSDLDDAKHTELRCALLDAVQSQAATEARHAAELREQAERFSEALQQYYSINGCAPHPLLAPFISPAPDPLVEVMNEMGFGMSKIAAEEFRAAMQARGYEWRKIGEAGE